MYSPQPNHHLKMLGTAPTLRSAALGCRIQPTLLTPCTFHTSSSTARSTEPSSAQRRVPLAKLHVTFNRPIKPSTISIRSASTTSDSSSSPAAAESTKAYTNPEILDWNSFFKLRRTRRYYQLGSSIGCGINGFIAGASILSRSDMVSLLSSSTHEIFRLTIARMLSFPNSLSILSLVSA